MNCFTTSYSNLPFIISFIRKFLQHTAQIDLQTIVMMKVAHLNQVTGKVLYNLMIQMVPLDCNSIFCPTVSAVEVNDTHIVLNWFKINSMELNPGMFQIMFLGWKIDKAKKKKKKYVWFPKHSKKT